MKVADLIEALQGMDPGAEVHVPRGDSDTTRADDVYWGTATYGILTSNPITVPVVVIDYITRGL